MHIIYYYVILYRPSFNHVTSHQWSMQSCKFSTHYVNLASAGHLVRPIIPAVIFSYKYSSFYKKIKIMFNFTSCVLFISLWPFLHLTIKRLCQWSVAFMDYKTSGSGVRSTTNISSNSPFPVTPIHIIKYVDYNFTWRMETVCHHFWHAFLSIFSRLYIIYM